MFDYPVIALACIAVVWLITGTCFACNIRDLHLKGWKKYTDFLKDVVITPFWMITAIVGLILLLIAYFLDKYFPKHVERV